VRQWTKRLEARGLLRIPACAASTTDARRDVFSLPLYRCGARYDLRS